MAERIARWGGHCAVAAFMAILFGGVFSQWNSIEDACYSLSMILFAIGIVMLGTSVIVAFFEWILFRKG